MAHSEALVPPSATFSAIPFSNSGKIATKTPSAPVFRIAFLSHAFIKLVQARPSPATNSG